jgi:hypothetical protein
VKKLSSVTTENANNCHPTDKPQYANPAPPKHPMQKHSNTNDTVNISTTRKNTAAINQICHNSRSSIQNLF